MNREEAFRIFEGESDRFERALNLVVILKRIGLENPSVEDVASVVRWADAHVSGGLDRLMDALEAETPETAKSLRQLMDEAPVGARIRHNGWKARFQRRYQKRENGNWYPEWVEHKGHGYPSEMFPPNEYALEE
jgi:hypothetical protein